MTPDLDFPPGPRTLRVLQALGSSTDARLDALQALGRDYGDIAHINVLGTPLYFLNHPDLIRRVLLEQADRFYNMPLALRNTGVLNVAQAADFHDHHRSMRKLLAPAFTPAGVAPYADTILDYTQVWLDGWPRGEIRNINTELTRLTLRIVGKVLFDVDLAAHAPMINNAVTRGMQFLTSRWRPIRTPVWIPTLRNIKLGRAWLTFDGTIKNIVADRRRNPTGGADLLSRMYVVTEASGAKMSAKEAHTQIMSLLIAGHETTATTLSWALHHLTANQTIWDRLCAEAEAQSITHALGINSDLPYTHAVACEVIRLYPPAYVLQRYAVEPTEVGGYIIPRGGSVFMSAFAMHRDPRFFTDPEVFNPDRWSDGLEKRLPPFAYFPFGGGTHICTGQFLAWLELHLILAVIATTARFARADDIPPDFAPTITLRPAQPILLRRVM